MSNCTCGVKFTGGLCSDWCDSNKPLIDKSVPVFDVSGTYFIKGCTNLHLGTLLDAVTAICKEPYALIMSTYMFRRPDIDSIVDVAAGNGDVSINGWKVYGFGGRSAALNHEEAVQTTFFSSSRNIDDVLLKIITRER